MQPRLHLAAISASARRDGELAAWLVAALAWAVIVVAALTGQNAALHHHALIENGPPLWLAVLLFLASWQLMVAAMMVPASATAFAGFSTASADRRWLSRPVLGFVLAYVGVSSVFGLWCFFGDFVLHHVADTVPAIGDRPWLIQAGVVGLAGAYQLTPFKRRFLDICRDPARSVHAEMDGWPAGARHAVECLGSSWAQMLLMFAAGFANLWWMAALTGVMVYETRGRYGAAVATATGVGLIALSAWALVSGSLPAWPQP